MVAIVEAKNESLRGGVAQCIAELVAAQRFIAARGTEAGAVYGAV